MWNQILKNPQKLKKITQTAFNAIDYNNNHQIDKGELQAVMRSTAEDLGIEKPSKEEVKDILKQLDSDNKGYLSQYFLYVIFRSDFALLTQQVIKLINKNEQI